MLQNNFFFECSDYKTKRQFYATDPYFDSHTQEVAKSMTEAEALEAFGDELEFGTGGLRGIMGVGTNRFNLYTVRKVSCALASYLLNRSGSNPIKVAIAYDTRNGSYEFALEAAKTLCAYGITSLMFIEAASTPMLSFAVSYHHCDAGVVITASHNPKEYNGYKIYTSNGCQAVPAVTSEIASLIHRIKDIRTVSVLSLQELNQSGKFGFLGHGTVLAFVQSVLKAIPSLPVSKRKKLKIVYSPLNGAGKVPVTMALRSVGYQVCTVPGQTNPDGNFTTVGIPNPENPDAMKQAIALAKEKNSDIVLATDADADRLGVAVRSDGGYISLTGNQIGALLIYFLMDICEIGDSQSTVIKTVVTNDLGAEIAKAHGARVLETLTGFKYIGEQCCQIEQDPNRNFLFGYEESFGYLTGSHAHDKDATVSAVLICDLATYCKSHRKTLPDLLTELYAKYGFYLDRLDSYTFEGTAGKKKICQLMEIMRTHGKTVFPDVETVLDYSKGIRELPKSDVLKFYFKGGSWLAVRPSGTEPKIKIYYSVKATDRKAAETNLQILQSAVKNLMESLPSKSN